MKIYLVRHLQTNYNVLGIVNSDPKIDVHLSDEGIKQSENLRDVLKDAKFEKIYISELPRTRQTAEILNQSHQKKLIVEPLINENKTGFEGKPVSAWHLALDTSGDSWGSSFNDGESREAARLRAVAFIEKLRKEETAEEILVVTHGFITQMIFGAIENRDRDEASKFNIPQGTYAEFDL